jgi:SAM-dependent methyltransferase
VAEHSWRETARTFHERAEEYDGWFTDSPIFAAELAALRALGPLPPPACEVGMGPGHFAAALGCNLGIDPARAPLRKALARGIPAVQSRGEFLPLADASLGAVALIMTLCFIEEPVLVLAECRRVIRPGGMLVLGFVPAAGPWGQLLTAKSLAGHPYYRHARLLEVGQVEQLLNKTGFVPQDWRATLFQPPDEFRSVEAPRPVRDEQAGFLALRALRG